jgi:hypothetical protein
MSAGRCRLCPAATCGTGTGGAEAGRSRLVWGVLVYYSAGVAGLASFGAASALPDNGPLWLLARLLLDGAGGLFGLYLLAGLGMAVAGRLMSDGRHRAGRAVKASSDGQAR